MVAPSVRLRPTTNLQSAADEPESYFGHTVPLWAYFHCILCAYSLGEPPNGGGPRAIITLPSATCLRLPGGAPKEKGRPASRRPMACRGKISGCAGYQSHARP